MRKPGSTPATISAVPVATDLRTGRQRAGAAARPPLRKPIRAATPHPSAPARASPASDASATSNHCFSYWCSTRVGTPPTDSTRMPPGAHGSAPARVSTSRAKGPVRQTATRSEVTSSIRVSACAPSSRSARTRAALPGDARTSSRSVETTHHHASAASRARPGRSSLPDGCISAIVAAESRTSNLLMDETSASPAVARLTAISAASEPKSAATTQPSRSVMCAPERFSTSSSGLSSEPISSRPRARPCRAARASPSGRRR